MSKLDSRFNQTMLEASFAHHDLLKMIVNVEPYEDIVLTHQEAKQIQTSLLNIMTLARHQYEQIDRMTDGQFDS